MSFSGISTRSALRTTSLLTELKSNKQSKLHTCIIIWALTGALELGSTSKYFKGARQKAKTFGVLESRELKKKLCVGGGTSFWQVALKQVWLG